MAKTEKLPDVTPEMFQSINEKNRKLVDEYLRENVQLSPYTLLQYESALKIYFWWIKEYSGDKDFDKIKSRDFLQYQNWLIRRGLSSSAVRFKRSVVSSLNGYILTYYEDEYPMFRNYITKSIPTPKQVFVNDKEPLTLEEYKKLCNALESKELWQQLAYLKFSFSTGARRNEVRQLLKEIVGYDAKISIVKIKNETGETETKEAKSYITHPIRCKGSGKEGKIRKLQFDQDAMDAIVKWLEHRGEDDCPYVFVVKGKNGVRQVSDVTFNYWCKNNFEEIIGRRVHPHLFRESRATTLVVEQGRDIEVAKKLLGHESINTTQIYVIRDDNDASDEAFV